MLVMELRTYGGKRVPVGIANKPFDRKPAVLIHLNDFSLWATNCFAEGETALACRTAIPEPMLPLYRETKIDPHSLTQYSDLHKLMEDHVQNPSRILAAYYKFVRSSCAALYGWNQKPKSLRLDHFLPEAMQQEQQPATRAPAANKRPGGSLGQEDDADLKRLSAASKKRKTDDVAPTTFAAPADPKHGKPVTSEKVVAQEIPGEPAQARPAEEAKGEESSILAELMQESPSAKNDALISGT